jgi:hypothetical protein
MSTVLRAQLAECGPYGAMTSATNKSTTIRMSQHLLHSREPTPHKPIDGLSIDWSAQHDTNHAADLRTLSKCTHATRCTRLRAHRGHLAVIGKMYTALRASTKQETQLTLPPVGNCALNVCASTVYTRGQGASGAAAWVCTQPNP